jgi:hypothetical protein
LIENGKIESKAYNVPVDVKTRWNSTLSCIKGALDAKLVM